MTDKTPKPDANAGIMRGLEALDTRLREAVHASAKGGEIAEPGTGLHDLLALVASQFLGVPVQGFPAAEGATGATGPAQPAGIEPGSISAQAIEAGSEPATGEGHHAGPKADDGKHPDPRHRR